MSIQLFTRYQRNDFVRRRALRQKISGLILISALTSCSPVAESILKTSRFASARPSSPGNPAQEVVAPLAPAEIASQWRSDFNYIIELVDASGRIQMDDEPETESGTRLALQPSVSGQPAATPTSESETTTGSDSSATQTIDITLTDEQLDQFREEGTVEVSVPSAGHNWELEKVRARFHVIQSELELIEDDEEFSTSASLRNQDQQLTVRLTVKGSLEDVKVHSTLSRLVRVELELESKGRVACATSRAAGGVIDPSLHE